MLKLVEEIAKTLSSYEQRGEMAKTEDILFEQKGCAGVVTLNKPETLNAVTDEMLTALNRQLDDWEHDPSITRVIIKAVPGRAFSAGGDIRHLYERGIAKDYDFDFFAREYRLNARIARFPKPYIALVDGIVMGGGVGVSFHGSHRVAGNKITFAMPEVGIGFFPDVGASYLLSRLPGALGLYLGLTGARVKQADALWCGLATHACDSIQLDALEKTLSQSGDVDEVLKSYSNQQTVDEEIGPLQAEQDRIDQYFDKETLGAIFDALKSGIDAGDEWAQKAHQTLLQKSPTSLAIAFDQIKAGKGQSIEDCMRMEFRILKRILPGHEFYEGIRAAIIDKDNAPDWQPGQLADIDSTEIERHFATLGAVELDLP